MKKGAREEIKQELNEDGNSYNIEELKKKWNILRTQYRNEQKLVNHSKKIRKLELMIFTFQNLQFVRPTTASN